MSPAEHLKRARESAGLTQEQLAAACGMRQQRYSHLETGRRAPRLDELKALALALPALDVARLVLGEDAGGES
jgi:transcriptional regulator with XRE-family HTH domain